jgi:hypothetical protein
MLQFADDIFFAVTRLNGIETGCLPPFQTNETPNPKSFPSITPQARPYPAQLFAISSLPQLLNHLYLYHFDQDFGQVR